MSKREGDGFDEEELINAEFESIVAGLSLDESTPTTYLDELDAIQESERFTPPQLPRRSLRQQFLDAKNAIKNWKNNPDKDLPDDGAAL
jgi:hypothetical protein